MIPDKQDGHLKCGDLEVKLTDVVHKRHLVGRLEVTYRNTRVLRVKASDAVNDQPVKSKASMRSQSRLHTVLTRLGLV